MSTLTVPHVSMGMEEVRVLRWLVADGDDVEKGQSVVEIETDKATHEVEAPTAGPLRIVAAEGALVPAEGVLATIGEAAEEPAPSAKERRVETPDELHPVTHAADRPSRSSTHASPAARRLARESGVDISTIVGSGPGGRILARDISEAASAPDADDSDAVGRLRAAVVRTLTASWREIPHIHIVGELDGEGLVEARRLRAESGGPLTATDLLAFVLARALVEVPDLNGVVEAGGARLKEEIAIALAVATPGGVVAPVIRDVGNRSLDDLARERGRLVDQARASALDSRDLAGGTVTLTNLGGYPVDFFMPIVSGPQIATLATGRIKPVPVALNGMIAVRHRLVADVAIDHRAADGEAGGRLLQALEHQINNLPDQVKRGGT